VAVEGTQRRWSGKPGGGRSPTMGPNFGSIRPGVSELWASASVGRMGERIYFIAGDKKLRRGEERRGDRGEERMEERSMRAHENFGSVRAREFWTKHNVILESFQYQFLRIKK
jgi:hypothetical protein